MTSFPAMEAFCLHRIIVFTVFKTYRDDMLIGITMAGTGSPKKGQYTMVPFPKEATRIEAISYDDKKKLVYDEAQ